MAAIGAGPMPANSTILIPFKGPLAIPVVVVIAVRLRSSWVLPEGAAVEIESSTAGDRAALIIGNARLRSDQLLPHVNDLRARAQDPGVGGPVVVHAKVDGRDRIAKACRNGVVAGRIDERCQDTAVYRVAFRTGYEVETPGNLQHEPIGAQMGNFDPDPSIEG